MCNDGLERNLTDGWQQPVWPDSAGPAGHGWRMSLFGELGIRYPIIQVPMAGVQDSALALAVTRAGGLGPCLRPCSRQPSCVANWYVLPKVVLGHLTSTSSAISHRRKGSGQRLFAAVGWAESIGLSCAARHRTDGILGQRSRFELNPSVYIFMAEAEQGGIGWPVASWWGQSGEYASETP